jgi:hypothetical protein
MTMNERIAVEPCVFESARDIKYLFEKCGFQNGRFIAQYPPGWLNDLRKEIEKLPALDQLRAKRVLENLKDTSILPCNAPFDKTKQWVDNALAQSQLGQFKSVIGDHPPRTLTLDEVDDEILGDARGERILQTAAEYARIAKPLLSVSSEIYLIDPYFRLGRPNRTKVLKAFISSIGQRPVRIVIISRHEELSKDIPSSEALAHQHILPLLKSGQVVRILSVVDDNENKMHARYLLSIKGAIKYDKGFEESAEDLFVDVEAVSKTLHNELVRLFIGDQAQHGFNIANDVTIRPPNPRRY